MRPTPSQKWGGRVFRSSPTRWASYSPTPTAEQLTTRAATAMNVSGSRYQGRTSFIRGECTGKPSGTCYGAAHFHAPDRNSYGRSRVRRTNHAIALAGNSAETAYLTRRREELREGARNVEGCRNHVHVARRLR